MWPCSRGLSVGSGEPWRVFEEEMVVGLSIWGLTAGGRMWDPGGAGGIWAVGSVTGRRAGACPGRELWASRTSG